MNKIYPTETTLEMTGAHFRIPKSLIQLVMIKGKTVLIHFKVKRIHLGICYLIPYTIVIFRYRTLYQIMRIKNAMSL